MAYNLSMQLNLQAPSSGNVAAVKKTIESGLSNVKIGGFDSKSFAKANSEVNKLKQQMKKGEQTAKTFFDAVQGKAASFAAYTVASTAILKLTGAVSNATREAIKYEAEIIKISQVTDKSVKQTAIFGKRLIEISKLYNVNITKIAQLTRTLAQTGISFREAAKGAELLARTSLLASFDDLSSTTEGLIAVMQTFDLQVRSSAKVLEEMNIVSKKFAVESGDIVEAIRRTGGAFSAAGGNVEELIALFTSVRSTSRESAETIATGFRTIFGRLQRPKTIEYFKELGIQLQKADGQFVGPFEAIKRLSQGLDELGIRAGSVEFAAVVEQIGGIRQLSKVVPLLEQFKKAQNALDIQNQASAESTKDIEKAQQGLGYQLGVLQKEFGALIQDVIGSDSFKFLAETFINISRAVIKLAGSFKFLLPFLTMLATFKLGRGLSKLLSGKINFKGIGGLAGVQGMASGGLVPGTGDGDTVPAMLTPGEFVIRKSAVQAFGARNLAGINKYSNGGITTEPEPITIKERIGQIFPDGTPSGQEDTTTKVGGVLFQGSPSNHVLKKDGFTDLADDLAPAASEAMQKIIRKKLGRKFKKVDSKIAESRGFKNAVKGFGFEAYLEYLKKSASDSREGDPPFDFKRGETDGLDEVTDAEVGNEIWLDATTNNQRPKEKIVRKAAHQFHADKIKGNEKLASGGSITGTDTVPALLTPGEFVINKKSSQAFGYGNLEKINKYAKGGPVQKFANGGITEDTKRGTGETVKTMRQFRSEIKNLAKNMGQLGEAILRNYNIVEETKPDERRGSFNPRSKEIRLATGRATTSTAEHEFGHAVDSELAGGKGFASEQIGTFQNQLVEAAKAQIEAELKAQGASEKLVEYRTKNVEIFADMFQKSDPAVRAIIASTTDASQGMQALGQLFAEQPEKFNRLYGDIHVNLESLKESIAYQSALAGKASKAGQAATPRTVTAKTVKQDAMSGGQGAITAQIRERAEVLKGLEASQGKAEEEWYKLSASLEKLDGQIAQGITNRKAQEKAAQIRIRLSTQAAEAEKRYTDITNQVAAVRGQKEELITQARAMKQQRTAGLKSAGLSTSAPPKKTLTKWQKFTNLISKATNGIKKMNISFAEVALQSQVLVSGLKNFAGLDINQQALTEGQVKGGQFSMAADAAQASRPVGKSILKFGNKLAKGSGKFAKYGKHIAKFGGSIVKWGPKIAKGLNILGVLEVGGGILDSIFSTDYGKQRDGLIALGDASGAAAAAAKAYSQEQYRAIPVIGSVLSAFGAGSGAQEKDLDSLGQLVVANARLEASLNGVDKEVNKAKKAFNEASKLGDVQGQRDAISAQLDAADNLRSLGKDASAKADKQRTGSTLGATLKGAGGGALAGAGVGALVGGPVGAAVGAAVGGVIGGTIAWIKASKMSKEQIVKGYELNAEAIRKSTEIQVGLIEDFGKSLQAAVVQSVRTGGGYADALDKITERFGQDNIKRMLGGRELNADDAKGDVQALRDSSIATQQSIDTLKKQQIALKDSDKVGKAEIDQEIAKAEAELKMIETMKEGIVTAISMEAQEKRLLAMRKIHAQALEEQIALQQALNKATDVSNAAQREVSAAEEALSLSGTGQMTTREAIESRGFDARTVEMSGEELVRSGDSQAIQSSINMLERFGAATGAGGGLAQEARNAQTRLGVINRLGTLDTEQLLQDTDGTPEQEKAEAVKNAIVDQLRIEDPEIDLENDLILNSALLKYAQAITGGIEKAAQAQNDAREAATESAVDMHNAARKGIAQIGPIEQRLQKERMQLRDMQMSDLKAQYDSDKRYADEFRQMSKDRIAFFDVDQTTKGRNRAARRKVESTQTAAKDVEKRREVFAGGSETITGNITGDINAITANLKQGGSMAQEAKKLGNQYTELIRDQIDAEKDKLSALREQAMAQRDAVQALRDAQGDLVNQFAFGTDEQRGDLLKSANAAQFAASQGSLQGLSGEMRGEVASFLDRFSDVALSQFGGRTGAEVKGDIAAEEAVRAGIITRSQKADFAAKAAKKAVPISEQMRQQIEAQEKAVLDLINHEKALKDALLAQEKAITDEFGISVNNFALSIDNFAATLGSNLNPAQARERNRQQSRSKVQDEVDALQAKQDSRRKLMEQKTLEASEAKKEAKRLSTTELHQLDKERLPQLQKAGAISSFSVDPRGSHYEKAAGPLTSEQQNMLKQFEKDRSILRSQGEDAFKDWTGKKQDAAAAKRIFDQGENTLRAKQEKLKSLTEPLPGPDSPANPEPPQPVMSVETTGSQQITVSLPDIQALVSKDITGLVLNTVGQVFNKAAEGVANANDIGEVATALQGAAETSTNRPLGVNA